MERLPDRPEALYGDQESNGKQGGKQDEKNMSRRDKMKKNFSTYGLLIVVCIVIFFIMADEPVPLDGIQVTKIEAVQNEKANGIFVVGELSEDQGRFCKAPCVFNEESGVAEVYVRQYQVTTFFGSKEFAAYIEEDPALVKEIWLVYDDGKGGVEKRKLEYGGGPGSADDEGSSDSAGAA